MAASVFPRSQPAEHEFIVDFVKRVRRRRLARAAYGPDAETALQLEDSGLNPDQVERVVGKLKAARARA